MGSYGLGPNLAVELLDLSDTGVRLIVKEPLETELEVEILIEGYGIKGVIKRLGNVRWARKLDSGGTCIGIEFQRALAYRDWQVLIAPR